MRHTFFCLARILAALVAFALSPIASGQSVGTTFSDLWWNPNESGWCVTVDHQQDVMFLTFFVYKSDSSPYWVVAVLSRSTNASSPFSFSGDVYEYSGPAFAGPFNPALVSARRVGAATFAASGINVATLTYSVNGVSVTKTVQRQTLQNLDFSGTYNGVFNYELRA